jgi:IS30 family transposase
MLSNLNTNLLIRQYVSKQLDLRNIFQVELLRIADRLNPRPRKTLDFKTPYELFCKEHSNLAGVALRN